MSNELEAQPVSAAVESPAWERLPARNAAITEPGIHEYETLNMARKKEKMEMPVCTRVSVSTFRALEVWCDNSFRKRSEVVGIVLERIVDILSQQQCIEQPVEEFVRRLKVGPRP
ncbi:MAG: hypothetical protein KGM47_18125 [Acidobacteriota bacterium]|nr:hypothetical protein [Acidobacteriota bacterium]